ncbi:hypothetical protein JCM8097_008356 [Rhodosporidiobolus ruineniae]
MPRYGYDDDYECGGNWTDDCLGYSRSSYRSKKLTKKRTPPKKVGKQAKPAAPSTPRKSAKVKAAEEAKERAKKPFPLLDLPGELIDAILGHPDLHLGDHLSLAASCKTLRAVYCTPPATKSKSTRPIYDVWRVLGSNRPFVGLGWGASPGKQAIPQEEEERLLFHLWTREDRATPEEVNVKRRSEDWEQAILDVNTQRIVKTTVKSKYKLTDAECRLIAHVERRNPHAGRHGPPMQLYIERAVESVAYELHGGAMAHQALLKKMAASAAKAADTKRKRKLGLLDDAPSTPKKKSKTAPFPSMPNTPAAPALPQFTPLLSPGAMAAQAAMLRAGPSAPKAPATILELDSSDDEDDSDGEYDPRASPTPSRMVRKGKGRA